MSRRSLRKSAFEEESNGSDIGLGELDEVTYGLLRAADKNRVVAEGRPIKDIYPDLRQPRRAIPSAVRLATAIDPRTMHTVFVKWRQMAEKECNTNPLRLRDMVEGLTTPDDDDALPEEMPEKLFPITTMLLKVVKLAKSIKENRLINPVTVVRTGHTFKLNTGERRWLAYHLLEWLYGSEWSQIPSQETDSSVWAQAEENLSREDLGGIALARQFALLVMECYPNDEWGQVEDFTEDGCDRAYYAQVADGNEWRIPRGMGQKIAGAMGIGESLLRHYRLILNIPDEIWTQADDQNWSAKAVREWIADENRVARVPSSPTDTVTSVTVSPTPTPTPPKPVAEAEWSPEANPALGHQWAASELPDLPPHHTLANIDTGAGANVAIPQDEMSARMMRRSSVVLPMESIEEALKRLAEVPSIAILRDETKGKREDLMYQMAWLIQCALNFTDQLEESFEPVQMLAILSRYEIANDLFQYLLIKMRTHATGRNQSNADTVQRGIKLLLENIKEKPDSHIEDRLALIGVLSETIVQELEIIQGITQTLIDSSQWRYVQASLGEADAKFADIADQLRSWLERV